jgi:hypothetical protein
VKVLLDAGALVAIDKRDRRIGAMLRVLHRERVPAWTSAAVVAQVWRHGGRQAPLAQVLAGVGARALSAHDGKRVGELLAIARTADVVDAHLALLVDNGDQVLTSDVADIGRLLAARHVEATLTKA